MNSMAQNRRHSARHAQRGMALLIALIVLVVVTILGAVAMRAAMFQNRVSINNQTASLSFQAAESGLDAVVKEQLDEAADGKPITSTANFMNIAVNTKAQRVCFDDTKVTTDDKTKIDGDGNITYTDPCPTIADTNTAVTTVVGPAKDSAGSALEAFDVKYGGSLILIEARARAEVPNTNVSTLHVQQWGVIGPADSEGG